MRNILLFSLVSFVLASCQTANQDQVSASTTDITISAKRDIVISALQTSISGTEWTIDSVNQYEVRAARPAKNIAIGVFYTCNYCPPPNAILKLSVIDLVDKTRVTASGGWLVNPGTPAQRFLDAPATSGWPIEADKILSSTKVVAEGLSAKLSQSPAKKPAAK